MQVGVLVEELVRLLVGDGVGLSVDVLVDDAVELGVGVELGDSEGVLVKVEVEVGVPVGVEEGDVERLGEMVRRSSTCTLCSSVLALLYLIAVCSTKVKKGGVKMKGLSRSGLPAHKCKTAHNEIIASGDTGLGEEGDG